MSGTVTSQFQYTCNGCHVAFNEQQLQRLHYKTDWHRYNLKRKIAQLPPVTAEEFKIIVLNQREIDQNLNNNDHIYCTYCKKGFSTENAYNNHITSNKHKENEKNYCERDEEESEEETVDSDDESFDEWENDNPIDNNNCLFCSHHSRNFIKNLDHMTVVHSFFIPDIEYCIDVHGLLHYLGEKVSEEFMCLWCNETGRTFHSAEAAQQHMIDKGHCKMLHEGLTLAEYTDFYDYSSSYPDADEEDVDVDEEISSTDQDIDGSDYQLVLPSGAVIGHRSLMKYYKQKISSTHSVVPVSKDKRKLHKILAHYRALGWTETQQKAAAKKARDIHYMKRVQAQWNLKLSVNSNKFQKHFRSQINF